MRLTSVARIGLVAGALGSGACAAPASGARAAFIQEVLLQDNRVWLSREDGPPLVADKFAKMASDPYFFMRGTAALHFADLARPDAQRAPTSFLREADSTAVLIFGDPHPENATVCVSADGEPSIEFIDLDASGFGPWTLDLRRAALGLTMLAEGLPGCGQDCQDAALEALVIGHVEGLQGKAPALRSIFDDLADEAVEEGAEQRKTNRYAPVGADGERALLLGEDTALARPTGPEAEVLARALEAVPFPRQLRVLDAARRYGSGVTSLPALRFVVLVDRGAPGPADDGLIQLREVVDPPRFPGRALARTATFEDNGQRVVAAARRLWSRVEADPLALHGAGGGMDFKTLSWTSWYQDIDHRKLGEDWDEGDLLAADLAELGEDLGRALGGSHARGGTASGGDAGAVIRADLRAGGGTERLVEEVLRDARSDRERLQQDLALFRQLLQERGPLLGMEQISEGMVP